MTRWVTIEKAVELTGLSMDFLHDHTGKAGDWPEGQVWKWFERRKLIDMEQLDIFIDGSVSAPSTRGRKKALEPCPV